MELGNPILVTEMRKRMRGKRAFAVVTLYALTLGLILGLFYWGMSAEATITRFLDIGLYLVSVAVFVQMGLICLISPTFTATAISSERERQTFELLVASLATPGTILFGKVGASLCYLVLVLLGFAARPEVRRVAGSDSRDQLAVIADQGGLVPRRTKIMREDHCRLFTIWQPGW